MPINQTCSLVLRDLYLYDIVSCYPTILSNMHYDFDGVDLKNKEERNIAIGKAQIGNKNLSSFLIESANNLVAFYLKENDITEDQIIVTQRDGFILTRLLKNTDEFINMDLREFIDFLIITPDREKFLYVSQGKLSVKGVSHKYSKLDQIYNLIMNLNFYNKKVLFQQMERIKKMVLESDEKKLFMIPNGDKFLIITKKLGNLEVDNESVFQIQHIDKQRYYDHYFREFLESIFLEFY